MADDDLSTAARQNRCVTSLPPRVRYALWQVRPDDTPASAIRELVLMGLRSLGWDERRISKEYLAFASQCAEHGEENPFARRREEYV